MKKTLTTLGLSLGLACASCQSDGNDGTATDVSDESRPTTLSPDEVDDDDEEEVEVPLDQVPSSVKAAALAALPGLVLKEAEMEIEDGVTVYELEGEVDGVEYEVEVTADGEVLEIERDDEDDEDDDDDDDDDEEDDEHEHDGHDDD